MPKGYKSEQGYATVGSENDGLGYREIAEKMTEEGHKMNHSTARNIFLSAMSKIAKDLSVLYGNDTDSETITHLAKDPRFQSGIMMIMQDTSV
tara:strand:- start:548 stop:826 length:279 start_codon:yes stop_codon:yes gene_type:complete